MAHEFDTTLGEAQRTKVRAGVAAKLAPLLRSEGLYLLGIFEIGRVIKNGTEEEIDEIANVAKGQTPCVMIALGRKTYVPTGTTGYRDIVQGNLTVHIYVLSRSFRSSKARLAGDVVSAASDAADPGVETILEHIEELLIGHQVQGAGSVYQLVPTHEDEIDAGEDYVLFEQQYEVKVTRDHRRYKGITQLITEIRTRGLPDGVPLPTDDQTVLLWTALTKTLQLDAPLPAGWAVGDQLEIVTGGTARRVVIATLAAADSVTLAAAPSVAPAPGDTVYKLPTAVPTHKTELP